VLQDDGPNDKRLVAYWVAKPGGKSARLRDALSQQLPDYMIPSVFVPLDALPLTANGKVDRRALPAVDTVTLQRRAEFVAPRTAMEESLADIWCDVLQVQRVGVDDNFFELGGHSLLAIRMIAAIEKRLHRSLPLAGLFKSPTIASLSLHVTESTAESAEPRLVAIPLKTQGELPPLIFMPPMGGDGLHWKALLTHWGDDRPIFALGSSGKELPWPADATLPEIARCCIECVGELASKSPVHLAGYSFGGKLAYEMARQLRQAGKPVGTVVIIDTGPAAISAKRPRPQIGSVIAFLKNLPYWLLDDIIKAKPGRLRSEFRRKARSLKQRLLHAVGRRRNARSLESIIDTRGLPPEYVERMRVGYAAAESYVAGRYSGRVLLVRARTRPLFRPRSTDLGWSRLVTGELKVIVVPGNHLSILEQPHCRQLALLLQEDLRNSE